MIYGHAVITTNNETYGYVNFNIEVRCKDARVKYILRDFTHKGGMTVNTYGDSAPGWGTFNIGSLTQNEIPESIGFIETGRTKKGREMLWNAIKSKSQITAYNLVQSLKSSLQEKSLKEKDNW